LIINEDPTSKDTRFLFGGKDIKRNPHDNGERLLGVYISADGKNKTGTEVNTSYIDSAIRIDEAKAIPDQIMHFITNMVFNPALSYKCKLFPLNDQMLRSVDSKILKLNKHKSGMAANIKNNVMIHQNLYDIKPFRAQAEEDQLVGFYNRLDGEGISSKAMQVRMIELRNNKTQHGPLRR
jgi:hypothetical protein